jgi:hypothetical protein
MTAWSSRGTTSSSGDRGTVEGSSPRLSESKPPEGGWRLAEPGSPGLLFLSRALERSAGVDPCRNRTSTHLKLRLREVGRLGLRCAERRVVSIWIPAAQ